MDIMATRQLTTGHHHHKPQLSSNDNDKPYIKDRYKRQSSLRSMPDYYTQSFISEAIQSNRAVIFMKNREDPVCAYVEKLFSSLCSSSEFTVYRWDEIPHQGDRIQSHLVAKFDSSTSMNCYVFVRGVHVPLARLRAILADFSSAHEA